MVRLRKAKQRIALTIGAADIANLWSLQKITRALSDFAESALSASCSHLLLELARQGELKLENPEEPEKNSGLIVLGMGKLGARELNYSSDIDLIILFDEDLVPHAGPTDLQSVFTRLAKDLVSLMDKRTSSGYVFRTDLRLRPDPGATPLAISVRAAESYYESVGQNWERAAMIKARPVSGDIKASHNFLRLIRPFVWRRSLDFAAIQDIHSIKRQINSHGGGSDIAVQGHNIKLGRGGIREIEFYAQTQQLIWGGRDTELRVQPTLSAIEKLREAGHVLAETAEEMAEAYKFLRKLEHRLQMVGDRQTHTLPSSQEKLAHMAVFMGFGNIKLFSKELLNHLYKVEKHHRELFEGEADLSGAGNLVFTGSEEDPDTLSTLTDMGFLEPRTAANIVRNWHMGRFRAIRSSRARELLTELVPEILAAFSSSSNPDDALKRFNGFLEGLPAGIQLFSLFTAKPGLLELVAEIMSTAPRLASWLSRHPILLDGVLSQDFFQPLENVRGMAAELAEAEAEGNDFQEILEIQRRWANDKAFQIGTHILRGRLSPCSASQPLTSVADVCLSSLLTSVTKIFCDQHGKVPGGEMALVSYGKLGSKEMTIGSDIDLLFVYDCPRNANESDGKRRLPVAQYYSRLCQRLIGAITAPTKDGKLYEVDMRLRPAGNAGPIASSFDAFASYQRSDAWTWEHQALTRARVICGDAQVIVKINELVREVISAPRDHSELAKEVVDMTARLRAKHHEDGVWKIKHIPGGLFDIEFIAQYIQLRDGAKVPELYSLDTVSVLEAATRNRCIEESVGKDLVMGVTFWRNLQGILRLTVEGSFCEERASLGLKHVISVACGEETFDELKQRIKIIKGMTVKHYRSILDQQQ